MQIKKIISRYHFYVPILKIIKLEFILYYTNAELIKAPIRALKVFINKIELYSNKEERIDRIRRM